MTGEIDPLDWHPKLKALHDYWLSKRPAGGLPRRMDIDPADIAPLLGNVFLVSVERDPIRLRYRLLGSSIIEVSRANMTGRYMDEAYLGSERKPSYADYVACVERAAVRYYRGKAMFDPDFDFLGSDRLLLPVTETEGSVDYILGGVIYRDAAGVEI